MTGTNIGFKNGTRSDETQFDTTNRKELAELWLYFCIENGLIEYIEQTEVM